MARKRRRKSKSKSPVKQILRRALQALLILVGLFALYIVISIIHGTLSDFQPEEKIQLDIEQPTQAQRIDQDELRLVNWNIGFAGLGASSNFFFDNGGFFFSGGKMVRSSKTQVKNYFQGIKKFLSQQKNADFVLLQEVDKDSKRSYGINEYEAFQKIFANHSSTFAPNYKASRVPLPVCEPWNVLGRIHSGLATFSKFTPQSATRYQFPGQYPWPNRIFHLDRCMSVHRFPTTQPEGKELLVINTHNSAYDGGTLTVHEMKYLQTFILDEYKKGNYIIVGGDWNQCPPGFNYMTFRKDPDSLHYPGHIPNDFVPKDWTWAYDAKTPTNRSIINAYDDTTFRTLIDFYLLSPNIELLTVQGESLNYQHSDHQPVHAHVRLKDFRPVADTLILPIDSLDQPLLPQQ